MHVSHGRKEVELKIIISHKTFIKLRERLNQLAAPAQTITQEDFYLDNPSHSFFTSSEQYDKQSSLRVRLTEDASSVCLKVAHKGTHENDFYRDEYEIMIDAPEKMLALFAHLGYQVIKTFKKARTTFIYGNYSITLDAIQGITPEMVYMCEIESTIPVKDHQTAITEMEQFLETTLHVIDYEKCMHGIEKYVNKNE